jgi:cytochrome oxidase assembly protein ShyY1
MKRLPLIPTLLVAAAIAVMIGLGVWQLQRAAEKEALLARYHDARGLPPIALPAVPDPANPPLFRRASAFCLRVVDWRAVSGRNVRGDAGWVHVASCARGAEGPGFQAVMGWSPTPDSPRWTGGPVEGVVGPDRDHVVKLVAAVPAPGLLPAKPPSLDDVPNNHRLYAAQWFFFAAAAAAIYWLALRRRRTD